MAEPKKTGDLSARNVVSGSNRLCSHSYVVYRVADGRRVEQAYVQSERAANSHAYTENIRLKNEGLEGQILGPELRGQAIEATRRLAPYGKSLRDAVDFYELSSQVARFAATNQARPFVEVSS